MIFKRSSKKKKNLNRSRKRRRGRTHSKKRKEANQKRVKVKERKEMNTGKNQRKNINIGWRTFTMKSWTTPAVKMTRSTINIWHRWRSWIWTGPKICMSMRTWSERWRCHSPVSKKTNTFLRPKKNTIRPMMMKLNSKIFMKNWATFFPMASRKIKMVSLVCLMSLKWNSISCWMIAWTSRRRASCFSGLWTAWRLRSSTILRSTTCSRRWMSMTGSPSLKSSISSKISVLMSSSKSTRLALPEHILIDQAKWIKYLNRLMSSEAKLITLILKTHSFLLSPSSMTGSTFSLRPCQKGKWTWMTRWELR